MNQEQKSDIKKIFTLNMINDSFYDKFTNHFWENFLKASWAADESPPIKKNSTILNLQSFSTLNTIKLNPYLKKIMKKKN